jgi:hypothetical protein
MTLRELEPGDMFVHANCKSKKPQKFMVKGSCMFNIRHGGATRLCWKVPTGEIVSKSCNLLIKKIGESVHKAKLNQTK